MSLEIRENEILANYSTFRIGGPARYFVIAKNVDEIKEAIKFARDKNLPYFILGGGSNILFRDEGYDGVVIKPQDLRLMTQDLIITVSSGTLFSHVIMKSIEAGLTGLEWGVGIPGTIGGCVAGNCGAYGHSISEYVNKIKTLDKEYVREKCGFEYRESCFKKMDNDEIILEIELGLEKGDKEKGREEIKNILTTRKKKIPPYPSIGSIFKNPKPLVARELIEQCGLKGVQIGGAKIADEHCNFIINVGNAKSADVLELIKICKEKVKQKFGVNLEEEIVIV